MLIKIVPALPEQAPVLANLLELYTYDFSDMLAIVPGEDGRFGYAQLPLYWKAADRHPFFIQVDGHLAGFVLLHKTSRISGDTEIWDITEFFVVRGYRRRGVGMEAAQALWKQIPGKWEVRVMERNVPAKTFWSRAIATFLGETICPISYQQKEEAWNVFSFESKG